MSHATLITNLWKTSKLSMRSGWSIADNNSRKTKINFGFTLVSTLPLLYCMVKDSAEWIARQPEGDRLLPQSTWCFDCKENRARCHHLSLGHATMVRNQQRPGLKFYFRAFQAARPGRCFESTLHWLPRCLCRCSVQELWSQSRSPHIRFIHE